MDFCLERSVNMLCNMLHHGIKQIWDINGEFLRWSDRKEEFKICGSVTELNGG